MRKQQSMNPNSAMNITPLIDILLVLLVIFMTITPLTPTGLHTSVPETPSPGKETKPDTTAIVLSLSVDGTVRVNETIVESPPKQNPP